MSTELSELKDYIVAIDKKVDRMMNIINNLKERNDDVAKDITKIKDAVYHPQDGLYARIKDLETHSKKHVEYERKHSDLDKEIQTLKDTNTANLLKITTLETWKDNQSKVSWIAITAIIGLAAKQLWDLLILK